MYRLVAFWLMTVMVGTFFFIINAYVITLPRESFMVAIRDHQSPSYKCSGTLISANYVLTAARCTNKRLPTTLKVYPGIKVLFIPDNLKYIAVTEISQHPRYKYIAYDIAVLKLASPVNETKYISYVYLKADLARKGDKAVLYGWGDEVVPSLTSASRDIYTNQESDIRADISGSTRLMFYAGAMNKTACVGEEGSPLVVGRL